MTSQIWGNIWEECQHLAVLVLTKLKGKSTKLKAWLWAILADRADGRLEHMLQVPWVEEGPNSIKQVLFSYKMQ